MYLTEIQWQNFTKTGSVVWSGNMDDDEERRASFVSP
jgi:hypothetical protein